MPSRQIAGWDLIDAPDEPATYSDAQLLRSRMLPQLRLRVSSAFA